MKINLKPDEIKLLLESVDDLKVKYMIIEMKALRAGDKSTLDKVSIVRESVDVLFNKLKNLT